MKRLAAWLLSSELAAIRSELARAHARLADYDRAWAAMATLPAAVGDPRPARADRIAASGLTLIPGGKS